MIGDFYIVYILLRDDFSASGTLYADDQTSFAYRDEASYYYINIEADYDNYEVTVR